MDAEAEVKETEQTRLSEKMTNLKLWILRMVVVLGLGLAEAGRGRGLRPHSIFDASSREELVDLAGYGEEKLSTVLITGSVLCPEHDDDDGPFSPPQPVSGVRVGVTCSQIKYTSEETTTDEFGDFTLDLPSHLHGTQNLDKACQVNVIKVPKGSFSTMEHNQVVIKLASARNGVRTYSAGKIHLKRVEHETGASVASAIVRLVKMPIEKWYL